MSEEKSEETIIRLLKERREAMSDWDMCSLLDDLEVLYTIRHEINITILKAKNEILKEAEE